MIAPGWPLGTNGLSPGKRALRKIPAKDGGSNVFRGISRLVSDGALRSLFRREYVESMFTIIDIVYMVVYLERRTIGCPPPGCDHTSTFV